MEMIKNKEHELQEHFNINSIEFENQFESGDKDKKEVRFDVQVYDFDN